MFSTFNRSQSPKTFSSTRTIIPGDGEKFETISTHQPVLSPIVVGFIMLYSCFLVGKLPNALYKSKNQWTPHDITRYVSVLSFLAGAVGFPWCFPSSEWYNIEWHRDGKSTICELMSWQNQKKNDQCLGSLGGPSHLKKNSVTPKPWVFPLIWNQFAAPILSTPPETNSTLSE